MLLAVIFSLSAQAIGLKKRDRPRRELQKSLKRGTRNDEKESPHQMLDVQVQTLEKASWGPPLRYVSTPLLQCN